MSINTLQVSRNALHEESSILEEFKSFKHLKNPMKVKKLALRMLRERTSLTELQKTLLTDVAVAGNASKTVKEFITRIEDCSILIQEYIEEGCHGMIMIGNEVYPVKLDTFAHWLDPNDPWDMEDEKFIGLDAGKALMKDMGWTYIHGKVMMFPEFGFSGIPRVIEMRTAEDTSKLDKVPGTRYYRSKVA